GTGVGLAPEVAILGDGMDIAAGDTTPSPEDHTDFGKAGTVGGVIVRTFTIGNSGTGSLTLKGRPLISISGPQAGDFMVTSLPPGTVPPGGDTSFQITFLPSAPGLRQATIQVSSDDENEGNFHFAVHGSGRFPGEVQAVFSAVLGRDIQAMALQGDGKILIGLNSTPPWLMRLQADGTLDTDFKSSLYSQYGKGVAGIAVQPDGKILVTGSFTSIDDVPAPGIARLLPDGTPDRTFQSAGSGQAVCMTVQPDGKILLGGNLRMEGASRGLVRLNADGAPDPSFNLGSGIYGLTCLALMENGKIMAGGEFTTVGGMAKRGIARLNADGTLDPEFNAAPNGAKVQCMAPLGDGKLIIAGFFNQVNGILCDGIVRLLADGSVDPE
ncbi:MAG: choice-of-anchor D domain-containing protein, partial [Verrucomicrobiaceae bacterium]